MVAISTTAEVAMSRTERVDSDLRRWMKVGFIRESFKGFKGFKSSKGLMTTVLVVCSAKVVEKVEMEKDFRRECTK